MRADYYRIHEIAALFDLHPDTLRYYEQQGLITPRRAENNYRLYSIQDICDLNIIQTLRSLDVPVARIREYMTGRTVGGTLDMLRDEAALIDARIDALRALKAGVRRRSASIRAAQKLPVGRCRVLQLPLRHCYRLSEGITLEKDVDALLKKLEKKHEKQLRWIGDRQMGAALDAEWVTQGVYNRYAYAFFICEDITDFDDVLPAGRYASLVYRGSYEHINDALPTLQDYVRDAGLAATGAPIELYHIDIHDTGLRDEFITELQLPVA